MKRIIHFIVLLYIVCHSLQAQSFIQRTKRFLHITLFTMMQAFSKEMETLVVLKPKYVGC